MDLAPHPALTAEEPRERRRAHEKPRQLFRHQLGSGKHAEEARNIRGERSVEQGGDAGHATVAEVAEAEARRILPPMGGVRTFLALHLAHGRGEADEDLAQARGAKLFGERAARQTLLVDGALEVTYERPKSDLDRLRRADVAATGRADERRTAHHAARIV